MSNMKVQLKDNGNNLFPNPNLVGIDTTNLIASFGDTFTYTATKDCFAIFSGIRGSVKINGVKLVPDDFYNASAPLIECFLKKGDIVSGNYCPNAAQGYCKVFGLKYI